MVKRVGLSAIGWGLLTVLLLAPAGALGSRASVSSAHGGVLGWASIPAAARGPVSTALGTGDARYLMRAQRGEFLATSARQGLTASFGPTGVRVTSSGSLLGLRLAGFGYGDSLTGVPAVAPSAKGNHVSYAHAGVLEWFANGPLGIEQGFTVARPAIAPAGSLLTLSLRVCGNTRPSIAAGGKQAIFSGGGRPSLAYRDLSASDASGRPLSAWLALSHGRLAIVVDTRGAHYPLRIDPLIQQVELTPGDGVSGDGFGAAVAMSGDGSTIAVGAPGTAGTPNDPGAVYVFQKPIAGWSAATQSVKLTAQGGAGGDELGYAVAISSDGSTIVAGARHENTNTGAAYVFVKSGTTWTSGTQTAELTVAGGSPGDYFGSSVAVSSDGSTVVVGAPRVDGNWPDSGAGYVFSKPTAGNWGSTNQAVTLTAAEILNDPDPAYDLGSCAAISADGSTIVLGASGVSVNGSMGGQGGAYVYVKPGLAWVTADETARLTASDGDVHDMLGTSVATDSDGSTIVAGAPSTAKLGAAYLFTKPTLGGWADANENAKLTASDGSVADELGSSLAISADGSTVVAGAFTALAGGAHEGGSYLFTKPTSGWISELDATKLVASNAAANNQFGYAVAASVDASTTVATATAADAGIGSAYVFGSGSSGGAGTTSYQLSTSVTPSGGGTIASQRAGITCPSTCSATYATGTSVTLTATPASGYTFAAWSGDCAGTTSTTCTVTMSQARSVGATFSNVAPTTVALSCAFDPLALSEGCTATVSGGTSPPTGQILFQASSEAEFPAGSGCTLAGVTSCEVYVLPVTFSSSNITVSASYSGDATHAPSATSAQFAASTVLAAQLAKLQQSCSVFVVNSNQGGLTSLGPIYSGTFVASMSVVAASAFGLIPAAPGASSSVTTPYAATDAASATMDTTCNINSSPVATASTLENATKCSSAKARKGKTKCPPPPIVIALLKKVLTGGQIYKLRVPLTAAGHKEFKLLAAVDKAYRKKHHGKHVRVPQMKIKVTITYKSTG